MQEAVHPQGASHAPQAARQNEQWSERRERRKYPVFFNHLY